MASEDLRVSSPAAAAQALETPPAQGAEAAAAQELQKPPTQAHEATGAHAHEATGAQGPPRLADGMELIGEFEGSGFKQAPFIARRADGQVVQLPRMLYQLAEQIDGEATFEQVAQRFSEAIERQVEGPDVQMLIEEQLRPLGIVAQHTEGESIELGKVDPLLALKLRAAVVPDSTVRSLTTVFRPLFLPPVFALAVLGMLGLDGWLFFVHGVSQSLRHTLYQPGLMLMLIGGVVLSTAFHEIGHATACRYGGAKPGVMGIGVYIVWPAFYTDITDAYRLGKWGRLRTDVGGMYFNMIFALIIGGVYVATSFEPLLLLIVLQNFAIIQQSLPFLRLDGYYILSDITGIPDIFMRIRPVLKSFIPGRPADERVAELKNWVRVVVSGYILLIIVFLALMVLAMVINLPRMVATGYDSAALHYQAISPDFSKRRSLKGVLDFIQMLFLVLPGAGLAYTAARVGRRTAGGAFSWSSGQPGRKAILGVTGAAAVVLAAFSWWPNGEYRPLQPSERGLLTGFAQQLAALPTGRPSLTAERERQLGGAPTELQRQRAQAPQPSPDEQHNHTATPRTSTAGASTTPSPQGSGAPTTSTSTSQSSITQTSPTSTSPTSPTSTTQTSSNGTTPTPPPSSTPTSPATVPPSSSTGSSPSTTPGATTPAPTDTQSAP